MFLLWNVKKILCTILGLNKKSWKQIDFALNFLIHVEWMLFFFLPKKGNTMHTYNVWQVQSFGVAHSDGSMIPLQQICHWRPHNFTSSQNHCIFSSHWHTWWKGFKNCKRSLEIIPVAETLYYRTIQRINKGPKATLLTWIALLHNKHNTYTRTLVQNIRYCYRK